MRLQAASQLTVEAISI